MSSPTVKGGSRFASLARTAVRISGRPGTFVAAVVFILLWVVAGPLFGWSDTWQLVINTSTTIITFLMIFLLQSSQNRDAEAVQLKLDELIRVIDKARDSLVSVEELDDEERSRMKRDFDDLGARARGGGEPERERGSS